MFVDSCGVICFEFSNSLSAIFANIRIDNSPSHTVERRAMLFNSERWYELVVNGLI